MSGIDFLDQLRTDIEDFELSGYKMYNYEGYDYFILEEDNIAPDSITVKINGIPTTSFTFDESTGELTLTIGSGIVTGDSIVVRYTYYANYSDTLLKKYIKVALSRIAFYYPKNIEIVDISGNDFYLGESDLTGIPEVSNGTYGLVELIAQILIKPDWSSYRVLDIAITFKDKLSKEDRISKLINNVKTGSSGIGIFDNLPKAIETE